MSGSKTNKLGETLQAPSLVRLFGREFTGLALGGGRSGGGAAERLARIYAFSYQGRYYEMAAPAVFVVPGPGTPVPAGDAAVTVELLGASLKPNPFAEGLSVWAVDKLDQITRIDIATGWVEDVLLDAEIDDQGDGSDLTGRSEMVGRSEMIGRPRRR